MKVPFSLLSTSKKPQWLRIVAHPLAPSRGVVRVKVRPLPLAQYRDLKNALLVAEKNSLQCTKNALQEPFTVEKERALDKARDEEREAQKALILEMVIDHDSACFAVEVPVCQEGTILYEEVQTILAGVGYSEEESINACATGKIAKTFARNSDGSTSPEMYDFYRVCIEDGYFLRSLMVALLRLMDGDIRTPVQQWRAAGVPEEDIPKDF